MPKPSFQPYDKKGGTFFRTQVKKMRDATQDIFNLIAQYYPQQFHYLAQLLEIVLIKNSEDCKVMSYSDALQNKTFDKIFDIDIPELDNQGQATALVEPFHVTPSEGLSVIFSGDITDLRCMLDKNRARKRVLDLIGMHYISHLSEVSKILKKEPMEESIFGHAAGSMYWHEIATYLERKGVEMDARDSCILTNFVHMLYRQIHFRGDAISEALRVAEDSFAEFLKNSVEAAAERNQNRLIMKISVELKDEDLVTIHIDDASGGFKAGYIQKIENQIKKIIENPEQYKDVDTRHIDSDKKKIGLGGEGKGIVQATLSLGHNPEKIYREGGAKPTLTLSNIDSNGNDVGEKGQAYGARISLTSPIKPIETLKLSKCVTSPMEGSFFESSMQTLSPIPTRKKKNIQPLASEAPHDSFKALHSV